MGAEGKNVRYIILFSQSPLDMTGSALRLFLLAKLWFMLG